MLDLSKRAAVAAAALLGVCLWVVPASAENVLLGDLRFGAAYSRARALAAEIKTAQAQVAMAEGMRDRARAAQYPQLGAKLQYDYAHQEVKGDYFGVADIDRADSFDRFAYGLGLSQGLYRPDLWGATDIASSALRGADYELTEVEAALAVRVAQEYLRVTEAMEMLRAHNAQLSATEEQQRQIEIRQSAGLVRDADVAAVRAAREIAVADQIEAENNLEAARLKLALTVGGEFKRVGVLMPKTPLPRMDPPDLDAWVRLALDQRPALRAAKEGVQAAAYGIDVARKRRLPTLDLVGSHVWFDSSGGVSGAREDLDQRIGVEATLPLFTSGALSAEIRRAEAQLTKAQAESESAEQAIRTGVQRAYITAVSAYRQIDARRRAVEAATEAERTSLVGLEVGTGTAADWLDNVRRRYEAERDFSRERLGYVLAIVQLKAAAGVLQGQDMARIEDLLVFPDADWLSPPDLKTPY